MKFVLQNLAAAALSFVIVAPAAMAQDVEEDTVSAAALDAERSALAQAIIDRAFPEETRLAMFQATADQMQAQMTQSLGNIITDEGAMAILTKWQVETLAESSLLLEQNVPLLMDAWASAYADIHTKQELEDILDFVSTPSGQAFMAKSTEVMAHPAFAAANQTYMDQTMELVMGKMPSLIQDLQSYEDSKQ